jgi:hypothetical protein
MQLITLETLFWLGEEKENFLFAEFITNSINNF